MDDSTYQIRQRIFRLILLAFVSVLFITVLLVMLATGIAISNNISLPPNNQISIIPRLEGYYLGHGNWDGVENAVNTDRMGQKITLLDSDGQIVIENGTRASKAVDNPYVINPNDILIKLMVAEQGIGTLVFDRETGPSQLGTVTNILLPVSLISVFLAMLAAMVGMLLSRQVVAPLAEVIAASRAVTAGKLETRVEVQGPQDLRLLIDSFNQMASSLDRNSRERRDLLADIAHELRTPISAIRGRLEGIIDGVYPSDQHHISLVLKANYMLERLVEDLRLLTLAESLQLQFDKKETDLKVLAEHSLEMFSAEAQEKVIQLQLLPVAGSHIAILDPQRTEQVIGNLVDNALTHTPAGGKVWLTLEKTGTNITLSICDNGSGIPKEDLPYIFNRFWRKDKSRARHTGGSGLGLAIAKQLIEAQGGTLSAENLSEGGLKVTITIISI